jgi:hypothetical protein
MRTWEYALIFTTFLHLIFGSPVTLISIAAALGLQVYLESHRWQLYPVYIASVLLIFSALVTFTASPPIIIRIFSFLGVAISAALGFVLPVPKIPKLAKPVGTLEHTIVRSTINDTQYTLLTNLTKDVRVRIWYPAKPSNSVPAVYRNYYPEGSVAPMLKIGLSNKLPHFFGSHFYLMKSNAAYDAPVSDERIRWPVLLMSHGLKGLPETYITLGEQLASEGFVVIAPQHTDGTSPTSYQNDNTTQEMRNQQLNRRCEDMQLVIDTLKKGGIPQLKERLDLHELGICGHSFGGATAVKYGQLNPDVKARVSWDGWMHPLLPNDLKTPCDAPIMFLNSELYQWEANLDDMNTICAHTTGGGYLLTVKGTSHHNCKSLV